MAFSCGGRRSSSAGAGASVLLLALLLHGCYSTRSWGQSLPSPEEEEKLEGPAAYLVNAGVRPTLANTFLMISGQLPIRFSVLSEGSASIHIYKHVRVIQSRSFSA